MEHDCILALFRYGIGAYLDTRVLFQNGEEAISIVEKVAQRNGPIFAKIGHQKLSSIDSCGALTLMFIRCFYV